MAHLLGFNKNTVQRVFQIRGWQVRKRPVGFRPRIEARRSRASQPNERWATDLCRVWAGRDGWATLALVIDCFSRELLGWHLSRSGQNLLGQYSVVRVLKAYRTECDGPHQRKRPLESGPKSLILWRARGLRRVVNNICLERIKFA